MDVTLSPDQTRIMRCIAQQLYPLESREHAGPVELLEKILAVQAQEIQAAYLSIRARSTDLTASQVDRARQEERSIAWTWAMRGTLHLLRAEDARWLIPLLGPGFIAADRRRMQQLGWDESRTRKGLDLLQKGLDQHGLLERPQVVRMLEQNDLPHLGQAPIHLLYRAALEGLICIGPGQGKAQTFVSFMNWIGPLENLPRSEALAKLAHRYLQAYAPATVEDFAYWSGLKMAEARQAWKLAAEETVQVEAAGKPASILQSQLSWLDNIQELAARTPLVNLLPRFDTYLLGYASRDLIVEKDDAKKVNAGGGIIRPVVLVDGRAVAAWRMVRQKRNLEVQIQPFKSLPDNLLPHIQAEVAAIRRFYDEDIRRMV